MGMLRRLLRFLDEALEFRCSACGNKDVLSATYMLSGGLRT
jgi:hypothetical protein